MPMRTGFTRRDALDGLIGPEHSRKFLISFDLCSVQAFAQAVEDGSITLRIIERGESVGDFILNTKTGHLLANKICPVIGNNGVGSLKRHTMFCQKI